MSVYQLKNGDFSINVQDCVVNDLLSATRIEAPMLSLDAPPIGAAVSSSSSLIMDSKNPEAQYFQTYCTNQSAGGLTNGALETWSYNNTTNGYPAVQVFPQSVSQTLPLVRVSDLQVTSNRVLGLLNNIVVAPQALQFIGGNSGTPTTLCSFPVPSGTFFIVCISSLASTTTYTPVSAFNANIYLSGETNSAYSQAVQFQGPFLFSIGAEDPRVTPVPLSTNGQIWTVKTATPVTTLFLVAQNLTPSNLCQATNLSLNATLLAYA